MTEQWRTFVAILSSLGLVSILIVIIGRLWTTAYFDYFGLETSDLEFSVYDFAFRSLEGLISIVLAVVGFSAAWASRSWLAKQGLRWALVELAVLVSLSVLLLILFVDVPQLGILPDRVITATGMLGIASGLVLVAMAWFIVDLWEGPGVAAADDVAKPPATAEEAPPATGGGSNIVSDRGRLWFLKAPITWRIFAIVVASATLFLYLPIISQELAEAEASADLASGTFPIAVLESDTALPSGIAEHGAPLRSVTVRVILTQSRNTYVLHSTQCTAIGELEVEKGPGGQLPTTRSDVCRVFAIPTSRLISIEYIQVKGSPPSNDTRFLAEEVDLAEPFSATVSTKGASDDDDIGCGKSTDSGFKSFKRTVWYRFVPSTDGTLLATVTSDPDLGPVVGIWEELEEGIVDQDPAPGSGPKGLACQPVKAGSEKVATIANVQTGQSYLIAIGTQNDRGGALNISLEFAPGASFLDLKVLRDEEREKERDEELPKITLSSKGLVQLKVRKFEMFELVESDVLFFLKLNKENQINFDEVDDQDDESGLTLLETVTEVDPGTWMLDVRDKDFRGQVTVSITLTVPQDLILAFAEPSVAPLNDIRVQGALLLVIDEVAIRDELGLDVPVIFDPDSFNPTALAFEADVGDDAVSTARGLLELAGQTNLAVQIEIVADPEREDELRTLGDAAEALQQQLLGLDLDVTIEGCKDLCIRVFFRSEAP